MRGVINARGCIVNTLGPILVIGIAARIPTQLRRRWVTRGCSTHVTRTDRTILRVELAKSTHRLPLRWNTLGLKRRLLVADVWGACRRPRRATSLLCARGKSCWKPASLIAQTRRPAPVLDENDKPLALLTAAGLFGNLADALGSDIGAGSGS